MLNRSFFPIRSETVQHVFVNLFSGSYHGLDIHYEKKEDGVYDFESIEQFNVIKDIRHWLKLDIRVYDEYIQTVRGPVRIPPVVVCANYNQIRYHNVLFPTKRNIYKRDSYTCGYTGKKLQKDELSVDHIVPRSRGGTNSWENLITCERGLNSWKSDRLPGECGLKLQFKPTKPKNGLVFENIRDEWNSFINNF